MGRTSKIVLFCSSFPPENGAAPIRMYHLAKTLQAQGFKVEVIAAMPNYPTGRIFPAYKGKYYIREVWDNIRITRIWMIPTNTSNRFKRAISLLSYSLSILSLGYHSLRRSNADLVILSSPPFVCGYFGTLISRWSGIKTLLNISDLWPQSAYDLGFVKAGLLYTYMVRAEKKMYHRADAFCAQSAVIHRHIHRFLPEKDVFIYRNLQPMSPYIHQERPAGKRKIIYAGLLGIAQGVLDIVRHIDFKHLGTELHIYGQGYELDPILEFISQYPEKGIHYMGKAPASEMPAIIADYHAMLIPLSTAIEGAVPSKIFNSIANGIPALFAGSGEGASIVKDNGIGWVSASKDFKALQKNIVALTQMDPTRYALLREHCIHTAGQTYNKAQQDTEFISFIKGLIPKTMI